MKRINIFLLVLLIGVLLPASTSFASESNVQSKVGITFTDSPEDESVNEEKESVPPRTNDSEQSFAVKSGKTLPKTGEQTTNNFFLMGCLTLLACGTLFKLSQSSFWQKKQ